MMIIKLDQKIQINFVESARQRFLLVTPRDLGFTSVVDFNLLFKKIKSMESIEYLNMKYPTVYDPDKIVSISLPNESFKL